MAKHVFLVTDPTKLEATVRTAFEIARTGRPGPVVLDVPKDVQNWKGVFHGAGRLPVAGYRQRMNRLELSKVPEAACADFFAALGAAKRPLIYAGGGVINGSAAHALREFSKEFQVPVVTTLMGIGAVDTTHPLSMRMLGMHGAAFANYAVDDCDCLLALGARFDDRVAGNPAKFAGGAKFIAHLDIDASEINKVKRVNWSHVGLMPDALLGLMDYGKRKGFRRDWSAWHRHCDELRSKYAMNYDRASALIQPYYVIEEIIRLTGGEAIITTGVGQHQMWAAQYFDFRSPRLWLTSGSMGTMGFGLPAAVGAQYAQRSRLVIDIDGDASIRMNIGELETVTTYDLPIKVVVLNNCGDGMVKQWQKLFHSGRLSASDKSLHTKDFVKAALADGFKYAGHRRVHPFRGRCLPRGHDRSRRRRLSHGRSRAGIRGYDHRGAHPLAHAGRHQNTGRVGNVLSLRATRRRYWAWWSTVPPETAPHPSAATRSKYCPANARRPCGRRAAVG